MYPTSPDHRPRSGRSLVLAAVSCIALLVSTRSYSASGTVDNCHIGSYRLADSTLVDIAPSDGDRLRWRKFDGTTGALTKSADGSPSSTQWTSTYGWTDRPDGKRVSFATCDEILFDGSSGRRIPFAITETTFHSGDVDLVGRLLLPTGHGRVPVVVLVHGAERDAARDFNSLQRLFPAEGVGAFVYDKRGTGASKGQYTQDFNVLADDAVTAMREARRIAGDRLGRSGYQGGSQGGWVVPLAVTRLPVNFAIVSFGLAVSVIDEDQQEVALEMKLKGHDSGEIAKALEVADAAETVISSSFTQGFEHFDAVRAKYRDTPWYKDVHGNYTYLLLPYSSEDLREKGKQYVFGTPWRYDPMPTLRAVQTAQLWVLGEDDLEAPSAETGRRLKSLIDAGHPITLALYPRAEHGMTEYEIGSDGERLSTRYAAGYFAMMRDFAKNGRLAGPYGASRITSRK
jgi:pimeloyl-ACP methyl ester carboxylesterase